tara:strand:+ start:29 stop:619 length:591 start_codon:yes stop_codon:yes gene_type:complete
MAFSKIAAENLGGSALPSLSGASLTTLNATNISSGTLNAARYSGGKILQVTSGIYNGTNNNSSGNAVDTGLAATLTPAASSSKILILCTVPYSVASSTDRQDIMSGLDPWGKIGSGSFAKISGSGDFAEYYSLGYNDAAENAERRISGRYAINMIWEPSTTDACQVKIYSHNNDANTTISAHYDSRSHMNLLEIGA